MEGAEKNGHEKAQKTQRKVRRRFHGFHGFFLATKRHKKYKHFLDHEEHEERLKNKFIVRRNIATKRRKMHKRDKKTAKKVLYKHINSWIPAGSLPKACRDSGRRGKQIKEKLFLVTLSAVGWKANRTRGKPPPSGAAKFWA